MLRAAQLHPAAARRLYFALVQLVHDATKLRSSLNLSMAIVWITQETGVPLARWLSTVSLPLTEQPNDEGPGSFNALRKRVKSLIYQLVQRAELIELFADVFQLGVQESKRKWQAERAKSADFILRHAASVELNERLRVHLANGEVDNAAAYATVRSARVGDRADPRSARPTWERLIDMELVELNAQPPAFWYSLGLSGLDEAHVRAAVHKIRAFEAAYGKGRVPAATRGLVSQAMLYLLPQPECKSPRSESCDSSRSESCESPPSESCAQCEAKVASEPAAPTKGFGDLIRLLSMSWALLRGCGAPSGSPPAVRRPPSVRARPSLPAASQAVDSAARSAPIKPVDTASETPNSSRI